MWTDREEGERDRLSAGGIDYVIRVVSLTCFGMSPDSGGYPLCAAEHATSQGRRRVFDEAAGHNTFPVQRGVDHQGRAALGFDFAYQPGLSPKSAGFRIGG